MVWSSSKNGSSKKNLVRLLVKFHNLNNGWNATFIARRRRTFLGRPLPHEAGNKKRREMKGKKFPFLGSSIDGFFGLVFFFIFLLSEESFSLLNRRRGDVRWGRMRPLKSSRMKKKKKAGEGSKEKKECRGRNFFDSLAWFFSFFLFFILS